MIAKHQGPCKPHAYQDAKYGVGFRVMNPVGVGKAFKGDYRCTVCGPLKEATKKRGGLNPVHTLMVLRAR